MAGNYRGQDLGQLLESGAGVRVVSIRELRSQASGKEEGHCLVESKAQGRQDLALDDAPQSVAAPQSDPYLVL